MTRASMVEVMATPYIRTALLKGLPYRQVVFKHALKNALLAPDYRHHAARQLADRRHRGGGDIVRLPGLGSLLLAGVAEQGCRLNRGGRALYDAHRDVNATGGGFIYIYLNPRIRYS